MSESPCRLLFRVGRPKPSARPVPVRAQRVSRRVPRGEKHAVKSSSTSFTNTFYQGIYQLNRDGERQLLAINYQSGRESDLRDSKPIELKPTEGAVRSGSTLFSFWPYLVMASLLLFIVEWFFVPPADRRRLSAAEPKAKLS